MGTDDGGRRHDVSTAVITADNAWVSINATAHYSIVGLARRVDEVYSRKTVETVAVYALRNLVGQLSSEQALNGPIEISRESLDTLNEQAAQLGVNVTRVEVTAVAPSPGEAEKAEAQFAATLRTPGFSVVLRGYDRGQVDDLLEHAAQAITSKRPDLCAVVAQALRKPLNVRLRGYDRAQVDDLLGIVAKALAR
jgi:DivIVA domain-containing protein